jgi:AraC family transcriptional regulator of adaptative response/methylated-DNA-[protein]-cysteine methyltransferase
METTSPMITAVTTTGIFCRPGCPAAPLPANTVTYETTREALWAGFRPCRRCHPLGDGAIASALELLEDATERPSTILAAAGIDPEPTDRHLTTRHGVTLDGYGRARRLAPLLRRAGGPAARRPRDPGDGVIAQIIATPLGRMLAAASSRGICLLEFVERRMLETQLSTVERRIGPMQVGDTPLLAQLRRELDEYFTGRRTAFDVAIDAPGTPFQERVWSELRRIPSGETRSYGELARIVGAPTGARAVARANGMNRVAIAIPCHRVIGADGALTGYAGGLDRKQRLLVHEGARGVV